MLGNDTPTPEPQQIPNAAAIARILSRCDRQKLESFIEIGLELVDVADGDPDLEPNGDEQDQSYPEAAGARASVINGRAAGQEDAEDDDDDESVEDGPKGFDPEEDCCSAGDDRNCSGNSPGHRTWGYDTGPGNPDDAEIEQMLDDVPCIPTYSLEPNVFTGEREYLGLTNLQPSFVGNGQNVKSAD